MKLCGRSVFVALVATMLTVACLGFGSWGNHKSSERATQVTFINMTKFKNGTTLPAGDYRMEVAENTQSPKVTFYKDGKAMASVNAKVVDEGTKNPTTEIDSVTQGKTQELTSIRPSGWHEKLVFESSGM
jgi:hypothetical protein